MNPKYTVIVRYSPGAESKQNCQNKADVLHFIAYLMQSIDSGRGLSIEIVKNRK